MRVVAFDSKPIKRVIRPDRAFKALLGVSVTITNYSDYVKAYNQIIDAIFKQYQIPRKKAIYKV